MKSTDSLADVHIATAKSLSETLDKGVMRRARFNGHGINYWGYRHYTGQTYVLFDFAEDMPLEKPDIIGPAGKPGISTNKL